MAWISTAPFRRLPHTRRPTLTLKTTLLRWLAGRSHDAADLRAWRERVLRGLVLVSLVLGTLVAAPSSLYAMRQGVWTIPVIDGVALGWLLLLLKRPRWPYALRAGSVVSLLYILGVWFMVTVGAVSQIYLMAFPVLAALMLGARPALMALCLNAATLMVIGPHSDIQTALPGLERELWTKWLVLTANFTFVTVLLTLSVSVLLLGLEVSLVREQRTSRRLEDEQDRLRDANEDLRLAGAALSRLNDLVLITEGPFDAEGGRIVMVNRAFSERTGYRSLDVLGHSPRMLEATEVPGHTSRQQAVAQALRRHGPLRLTLALRSATGQVIWTETDLTPLFDARDTCRHFVWVHRDVTERREAEARLRESEERWKLALESVGDGVWDWYPQTGREVLSPRFRQMYGYSEAELPEDARAMDAHTHPDDLPAMLQAREDHLAGRTPAYVNEHRVRCRDGRWKWVLSRGMVIARDESGRPLRVIGTHTDIDARKQAEQLIWQQARVDPLTGLPNRQMLRERLGAVSAALPPGESLVLMFLDLDHFKEVNDTLGHHRGDELLVEAARRIQACLTPRDLVARMGGDEFTVILHESRPPGRAQATASALLLALQAEFRLGDERAYVSASIGLARYPEDADRLDALLRHADQALYAAKDGGRNDLRWFTPDLQQAAELRVRLANDLRLALGEQQFEVHYQPIVRLRDGHVGKAEALLRWTHPQRGPIEPSLFIPVAESSGLIHEIGDWVFEQACEQVAAWRQVHDSDFQVSVNRSPLQFKGETSGRHWPSRLAARGLPASALVVEITEGLLLDADNGAPERLAALRAAGVGLALDDFGTGYSSLSYLKRYPIDYLKIDRVFVQGLSHDGPDLALCRAIIDMAHALGMAVIAEGVETAEQCALLTAAGCDHGQGHWFTPPLPAPALDAWLRERDAARPQAMN